MSPVFRQRKRPFTSGLLHYTAFGVLLEADFRKERGRENPFPKAVNGF